MPRYQFRWEQIPADTLNEIARDLGLDDDALPVLPRLYGMRPSTDFVRDLWPTLREGWLARDGAARAWVVEELRAVGLGDLSIEGDDAASELRYLQSCRNAERLRQIVLTAFHSTGDIGDGTTRTRLIPDTSSKDSNSPAGLIRKDRDAFDLDAVVDSAWSTFQLTLSEQLVAFRAEQILVINVPSALSDESLVGAAPFVQFAANGEDQIRAEVSSNAFLDPHYRLSPEQERRLTAIGWEAPTFGRDDEPDAGSANFYFDGPTSRAELLASMTVETVRSVFDVPHPSFLESAEVGGPTRVSQDAGPEQRRTPDGLVSPDTAEEFRALVDAVLEDELGETPQHDENGDVPIRLGSAIVFVRTSADDPIVELFSPVLVNVEGSALALERLNRLNSELLFAKLTWSAGTVYATIQLWCYPFAAPLVIEALRTLLNLADEIDDQLVLELGGRRFFDESPGPADEATRASELHPALMTILQLTSGDESLTAEEVAKICGYDRDLTLQLIRHAEEEVIAWRAQVDDSAEGAAAADPADDVADDVAQIEANSWLATVELLRAALRIIVTM